MDVKQIVLIVFVLLVIIYFIVNAFSKSSKLTDMAEAKIPQIIEAKKLKNNNNSSNYTYSMWLFIDDWNYKYGDDKVVLDRVNSPTVTLGDKPNTIKIAIKYYDTAKEVGDPTNGTLSLGEFCKIEENLNNDPICAATKAACDACKSGYTCACDACARGVPTSNETDAERDARLAAERAAANQGTTIHHCVIDNVPIQKWTNVIVSMYGRTLDVYLDGKLVRTCVIPGVPRVDNNMDLNVTPNGGFSGWTSAFKYWPHASNPQEAYNIYKDGFGKSILANAISKYRLRFSMVKNNKVQSSFEI
jgi:hypothetical protein